MTEAYALQSGPDHDDLLDEVAAALLTDDEATVASLYQHRAELTVPAGLP